MSNGLSRRDFNKLLLSGVAGSTIGLFGNSGTLFGATSKRVVVIGGGFGGASAAKYLRKLDPTIQVTLVEPKSVYHTCPFSNWVLSGLKNMEDIAHFYDVLRNRYKVNVIADTAVSIDADKSSVTLQTGKTLYFDRLIVAPGIDFKYDSVQGYSENVANSVMPHAWQAGTQTTLLHKQLQAMPNGGKVFISAPANPFRCPPGPYERASLIARYLKEQKPLSKVIIFDAKESFSKQGLFKQAWERLYPGMIEWRASTMGGKVVSVDAATMTVTTEFGAEKGDVINIIPAQKAGKIAVDAGLTDASGWCPINPISFESTLHPGIHVIGDAAIAGAMPKSGFAASSQGKVAAAAIVRLFQGKVPAPPSLVNTCYSLIDKNYAISVAGVYKLAMTGIVEIKGSGGLTPMNADADQLEQEAMFAQGWYDNISQDVWG